MTAREHAAASHAFIRDTQHQDWHDLLAATNSAINGSWSINAANIAARIVRAARLVGPTHHSECPWQLVAGGVYAAVLTAGGVPFTLTAEDLAKGDQTMACFVLVGDAARARWAGTVAAIQRDRETAFIRDGAE